MIDILTRVLTSSESEGGDGPAGTDIALYIIIGVVALAVIGMIIFTNISRKKQAKKNEEQRNSPVPGDVIETVGGIIGNIIAIRNSAAGREFIIETGEEGRKTTLTVDVQALYRVISQKNPPQPEGKENAVIAADVAKPETTDDGKTNKKEK